MKFLHNHGWHLQHPLSSDMNLVQKHGSCLPHSGHFDSDLSLHGTAAQVYPQNRYRKYEWKHLVKFTSSLLQGNMSWVLNCIGRALPKQCDFPLSCWSPPRPRRVGGKALRALGLRQEEEIAKLASFCVSRRALSTLCWRLLLLLVQTVTWATI